MLENALQLALYSKENSVPLKFLKTIDDEIVDTTQAITDDIVSYYMMYKYSLDDTIMIYYHTYKSKDDEELSSKITLFLNYIHEETKAQSYSLSLIKDVRRTLDMRWDSMLTSTEKRLEKLTSVKEFFDGIELDEESKESLTNSFSEENVVKSYVYKYEKFDITDENAKYVFNEFKTDENLFYIEYIDRNEQSIVKVYDAVDKELLTDNDTEPNTMLFKYKHQTDVIDIKMNIDVKKIEYSYYAGKNSSEVDNVIQTIFKDFELTEQKTLFVSGSFSIDIKNYKEYNFYYFTFMLVNLINRDASNIVYMRETFNPRALKKRAKYYFRDFENINHIDYIMSFTIDNVLSNLYNIKYRAKNKEKKYILEIAYLVKKYMNFYEENATTMEGEMVSDYFVKTFYEKTFEYQERSYTRIPTKIANLRNKAQTEKMFPSGGEYTKGMCECKLQPIIIDKEDVEDWEKYEDFNEKGRKIKHNTILFPPNNSTQGPKRNYVCPTHRYPIPVLKPNTGSNAKEYPYLPCCKMTGKDDYYDLYEETRLEGKGPIIALKQSDMQSRSLPLPLQTFFSSFVNDELEIRPVEVGINDSFIACLLQATKDHRPPQRSSGKNYKLLYENLQLFKKDYKDGVKKLRQTINNYMVHFETAKQEMFDYTVEDIINILTSEEYIDSMLFFKFFEYLFTVNIFVFTVIDNKPILEKPRYKDFHVRNIINELPAVYIYRDPVTQNGRYSLIAGKNQMFTSKPFQNLLPSYYNSSIEDDKVVMRINPYKNIIWEKIFKNFKIISQRINDNGKCYCLNIQVEKYGITIYIPPSAPLNVPVSSKIYRTTTKRLQDIISNGVVGSEGMWFMINGMKEIFVPCSNIESNDDICYNYVRDVLKDKKNNDYKTYHISTKNSSIFTELCVWMWRVSSLNLEDWFETYVNEESPQLEIFYTTMLKVEYLLPKYTSVPDCIRWISELNPEFGEVFKDEKVNIYKQLKENLYLYMKKVDSLTEGLPNFPSSYMSSVLSDRTDYSIYPNEMIFDDKKDLEDWKDDKFHNLEIFDTLENRGIYIYRNDKGMYLVVNTSTIEETLLTILYWNKYKKIVDRTIFTRQLLSGVTKTKGYRLFDTKLNVIREEKKESILNIIFYGSNLYSTFIKLI